MRQGKVPPSDPREAGDFAPPGEELDLALEMTLLATVVVGGAILLAGGASPSLGPVLMGLFLLAIAVVLAAASAARQWMPMAPAVVLGVGTAVVFVSLASSAATFAVLPVSIALGLVGEDDRRLRLLTLAASLVVLAVLLSWS